MLTNYHDQSLGPRRLYFTLIRSKVDAAAVAIGHGFVLLLSNDATAATAAAAHGSIRYENFEGGSVGSIMYCGMTRDEEQDKADVILHHTAFYNLGILVTMTVRISCSSKSPRDCFFFLLVLCCTHRRRQSYELQGRVVQHNARLKMSLDAKAAVKSCIHTLLHKRYTRGGNGQHGNKYNIHNIGYRKA